MQTFLPYPSFYESARCLDYRRLGKQRVECLQLLLANGITVGPHKPKSSAWSRHPAARMWKRFPLALTDYAIVVCREWRHRGYRDGMLDNFIETFERLAWADANGATPNWIGWDAFHASHRSNLLRKDAAFYGKNGWLEPPDLPYVWPVGKEEPCPT